MCWVSVWSFQSESVIRPPQVSLEKNLAPCPISPWHPCCTGWGFQHAASLDVYLPSPSSSGELQTRIFGNYGTSQTVLEASTWSTLILRHHLMPGVITLTIRVITPSLLWCRYRIFFTNSNLATLIYIIYHIKYVIHTYEIHLCTGWGFQHAAFLDVYL